MRNNADQVTATAMGAFAAVSAGAGEALCHFLSVIFGFFQCPLWGKLFFIRVFFVYPVAAYFVFKYMHLALGDRILMTGIISIVFFIGDLFLLCVKHKPQ